MRFSFASIVLIPRGARLGVVSSDDLRTASKWAASVGFEGIELNPRWLDFLPWNSTELEELREQIHSTGLVISGINVSRCILVSNTNAKKHYEEIESAIKAASILQAPVVTISMSMPDLPGADRNEVYGDDFSEEEFNRCAQLVAELGKLAQDHGVALSVETHDDGLLDSADALLRFVKAVDLPNVKINPDIGNLCRAQGSSPDLKATLERMAPYANNWHLKNFRNKEPVFLWEGDIDYVEAISIMKSAGYNSWISIESNFGTDTLALQEESLNWVKRKLLSGPDN